MRMQGLREVLHVRERAPAAIVVLHLEAVAFLEMHGESIREKKQKVAEIVAFLWEINYRNILSIET